MPKKRKRVINWGPFLWSALAVNFVVGIYASPLTATRIVRVEGADVSNKEYFESVLKSLRGKPALQVNPHEIESRLLATTSVASVNFRRNILGRGTVEVSYRKPIAQVIGEQNLYLSDSGVVFKSVSTKVVLPKLELFDGALDANLSLAAPWPMTRLAGFIVKLEKSRFGEAPTVEIEAGGAVSLKPTGTSAVIRFGAPYELDQKLAKLKELLIEEPELFEKVREVKLIEPNRPTVVP